MPEIFHDRFLAAVAGDPAAISAWCDEAAATPGLSVYRNTIAKGCADALVAQFPTLERVVGSAWLTAAATAFAAHHPPSRASLLSYGGKLPAWLRDFPPASGMPFLAGLAELDLLWTEAHLAADVAPLEARDVTALTPADFGSHVLVLHPATRFARFADTTPSLWTALQPSDAPPADFELELEPEGLLIVRPGLDIEHQVIGCGVLAFLEACEASQNLADAAVAGLAADPGLDLSTMFAGLIAAGAFTSLRTIS